MGLYDLIFTDETYDEDFFKKFDIINISNEIWLAFVQQLINIKETDIYAFSMFIDINEENYSDVLLYFGYNTESQYKLEAINNFDKMAVRWDYNYWLQNEIFCFGEDSSTNNLIYAWSKQQKLQGEDFINIFTKQVINAVLEIHESGAIKERFGTELPIIIHTRDYHPNIANINIKANGKYLSQDFVDYCNKNQLESFN